MVLWRPIRSSRTNTQKRYSFHHSRLECKSRKSRNTWSNMQIWPWSTEWSQAKANGGLPRARIGHSTHHLPTTQEMTLYMGITRCPIPKSDWLFSFAAKDEEGLYSQQKQDWELTVVQITNSLLPNSGTQGRVLNIYISNKYLAGADVLCLGATI